MSYWLNLIPKMNVPGLITSTNQDYHLLANHNDSNSYYGIVKPYSSPLSGITCHDSLNATSLHNYTQQDEIFSHNHPASGGKDYSTRGGGSLVNKLHVYKSNFTPSALDLSNYLTGNGNGNGNGNDTVSLFGKDVNYSTALIATIVIGCSLLLLNIVVFAGVYYHTNRNRVKINKETDFLYCEQVSYSTNTLLSSNSSSFPSRLERIAAIRPTPTAIANQEFCWRTRSTVLTIIGPVQEWALVRQSIWTWRARTAALKRWPRSSRMWPGPSTFQSAHAMRAIVPRLRKTMANSENAVISRIRGNTFVIIVLRQITFSSIFVGKLCWQALQGLFVEFTELINHLNHVPTRDWWFSERRKSFSCKCPNQRPPAVAFLVQILTRDSFIEEPLKLTCFVHLDQNKPRYCQLAWSCSLLTKWSASTNASVRRLRHWLVLEMSENYFAEES